MDSLAASDGSSFTLGFNGPTAISSCGENFRGGIKLAENRLYSGHCAWKIGSPSHNLIITVSTRKMQDIQIILPFLCAVFLSFYHLIRWFFSPHAQPQWRIAQMIQVSMIAWTVNHVRKCARENRLCGVVWLWKNQSQISFLAKTAQSNRDSIWIWS